MNITKDQSKQLRYACGLVAYNQPCTRKYTGTPEGKLREIGKFKYLENGGELKSFTYNGGAVNLDGITFDALLACIAKCEGLDPIPEVTPCTDAPAEPDVAVHVTVAPENDVHAVDVPVTVEAAPDDGWCTPENVGDWQEPDEMERVLKEAEERRKLEGDAEKETPPADSKGSRVITEPTEEGYVEPELPNMTPTNKGEVDANGLPLSPHRHPEVTREEYENALREVSMNAAAREALHLCNIECGPECYIAANILRVNATVPGFLDNYGKCLEQVGTPHSLEEIVAALPSQEKWLRSLAINDWKIKD